MNLCKAQLKLAQATLARDVQLRATAAFNPQQLVHDQAAVVTAEAQLTVAEAKVGPCKINLEFCRVTAPIDGQVGRHYVTPGNLVTQDQTLLTTIVSLDPMYVYFDIDEATALRVRQAIQDGPIEHSGKGRISVLMGLPTEKGFPHEGKIDFVDNRVNPTTGSLLVRGVFPNPLRPTVPDC